MSLMGQPRRPLNRWQPTSCLLTAAIASAAVEWEASMTLSGGWVSIVHIHALHDFLTARGWRLDADQRTDEHGLPDETEPVWHYPASFGGIAMHQIEDVSPYLLTCRLTGDTGNGCAIVVSTAGNWRGCDEHASVDHTFAVNDLDSDLDLDGVAALLADLEPRAQRLNARDLVECRFFAACGDVWAQ